MRRGLKIDIHIRLPMRRWHGRLGEELRRAGHVPRFVIALGTGRRWSLPQAALAVERRVFCPSPSLFDVVAPPAPPFDGAADLAIVLDGEPPSSCDFATLLVDGASGEARLVAAVARSGSPLVRIRARVDGHEHDLVQALLAVEHPNTLSLGLEQVSIRLVSLVAQGIRRFERAATVSTGELSAPNPPRAGGPLGCMARGLGGKLARRRPGAARGPKHWRIGFRVSDTCGIDDPAWHGRGLTLLPDDGRRFYADPFVFLRAGRTHLFFEDFPYASGKGVIGVVEIDGDGRVSAPRTVLEQSVHLSYPLVMRHGGEIYMLPEMSGARRVQLFRADPFPDRWVPDRILLADVVAADATPVHHDGKWWLFAALSDDGGSSWDQLGLFHAPDLLGPWAAHSDNPILVDAGAARPAGAMWQEDGVLMRVAQDCRGGYGAGLAVCRVDRLDAESYEQTVVRRLAPPAGHGADGVHTFNRVGSFEAIDLRFPPRSRRRSDASPAARRAKAGD